MKISVVFTGGTIGSTINSSGSISPTQGDNKELSEFFDKLAIEHTLKFFSPVNILSECITFDDMAKIISAVRESAKISDAVIVTHGTDSLSYSCAALSYALYDIKIPVVVVSSGHILSDPRSNGIRNLCDALSFCKLNIPGVFTAWNGKIHCGTRLCPPRAYSDEAESIMGQYYADISGNGAELNTEFQKLGNAAAAYAFPDKSRRVLLLPPAPELDYSKIGSDFDAVLFTSYHSGTTDTKNPHFIDFCRRLTSHGAQIFLHGSYRGADYESKQAYSALGICTLPVMSQCAAYMKLHLADFCDMSKSIATDILPEV